MVEIGGIKIDVPLALAPMAGVTDLAFRTICREQGAALTCTEMVSAKALCYQDKKSIPLLQLGDGEHPAAAQIFGSDLVCMEEAAAIARQVSGADFIDINMGCPVGKVVSNGDGSALMKDPERAARIAEAVVKTCPVPVTVEGLCVFDKRAILFGSEGNAKIFSSEMRAGEPDPQMMQRSNTPIAVVEAVDPIVLDARIMDCCCKRDCDCDLCEIPTFVGDCFGGELSSGDDSRRIYVTLGQFSIVRLERDTQLLVPVYDYCMPDKECACGDGCEDPCALFRNISFPVGEFFPPNTVKRPESCDDIKSCCK